ncbi:MAG: leucine-rich repeat domain-containing protein [Eubacterium sp.]|jgi:hypothetical protein|nr:leucine-rich repeat domain-containing protein [Eubacterium sp.]
MEQTQTYRIFWQKRQDGGSRLLRICGMSSHVCIPSQIAGHPVVEIAPYCFAGNGRQLPRGYETTLTGDRELFLEELCGAAVEHVSLPDTVKEIGNCAFYNCRKLKTLHMGESVCSIGSDAFMNTISLRRILFRCPADKTSAAKQVLSQISSDMEIEFVQNGNTQAKLFYPEYVETYDEIAPAHLFGRSIRGEGFRARQCFLDGRVDFAAYDAVFLQACVEESEATLSQMALCRLKYPYALTDTKKTEYRNYVKAHSLNAAFRMIAQRNLEDLQFLCHEKLIDGANLALCVSKTAECGWPEGTAVLIRNQAEYAKKEKKNRYRLDAFF